MRRSEAFADTPVREQATPDGPLLVRDTVVRLRHN